MDAFIFDIGNVLLRFDYGRAHRAVARAGAKAAPDMQALESLALRYERGLLDDPSFLRELSGIFGGAVPEETLASAWQEIFEPNGPMWDVVSGLHGKFPLYLLSNTNSLQHAHVERRYEIFSKFSDGVFSYRAGLLKPEPEIFALAIRQFGVRPERTFYIDDLAANIEGARAAGLRAMLYDPDAHGDFVAALRGCGVQCV